MKKTNKKYPQEYYIRPEICILLKNGRDLPAGTKLFDVYSCKYEELSTIALQAANRTSIFSTHKCWIESWVDLQYRLKI